MPQVAFSKSSHVLSITNPKANSGSLAPPLLLFHCDRQSEIIDGNVHASELKIITTAKGYTEIKIKDSSKKKRKEANKEVVMKH